MSIQELILPAEASDPHWRSYIALHNELYAEHLGTDEWAETPEAALAGALADTEHNTRRFLAFAGDVAVGWAVLQVNVVDSPMAASVSVFVTATHRRRGIGTALAGRLAAAVPPRMERLNAWVITPLVDTDVLGSPTGAGAVQASHPGVRMALKYGFRLGLVERVSRYDFSRPLADPHHVAAQARAVAGGDYDVVGWQGPTPEEYLGDVARLMEQMATDAPAGQTTVVEAKWDAQRVRDRDRRISVQETMFTTVAIHRESGRAVGLTELVVKNDPTSGVVDQWDTIVLREHRGRRLGCWLKAANVLQLRQAVPGATAIITFNAEENGPMLAVNEALGFHAIGAEGAFERKLRETS